ncbi:reverse transcriptase [Gossypium australe]|uniref:Reverse transcriptase n=1 Tax=Gossypium australe TaxID=47621 RepID=A0A5B6WJ49_9ROSI|nr:reverse transcriptase [Gossypium australe]
MASLKAPRIVGFSTIFFQRYWHIFGSDVSRYCLSVLNGDSKIGRHFSDNVIIAYEVFRSLKMNKKGKKGNFALKLDISKAYDRVE